MHPPGAGSQRARTQPQHALVVPTGRSSPLQRLVRPEASCNQACRRRCCCCLCCCLCCCRHRCCLPDLGVRLRSQSHSREMMDRNSTSWLTAYSLPAARIWGGRGGGGSRAAGAGAGAAALGRHGVSESLRARGRCTRALLLPPPPPRVQGIPGMQPSSAPCMPSGRRRARTHAVVRPVPENEVVFSVQDVLLALRPHAVGVKLVGLREALRSRREGGRDARSASSHRWISTSTSRPIGMEAEAVGRRSGTCAGPERRKGHKCKQAGVQGNRRQVKRTRRQAGEQAGGPASQPAAAERSNARPTSACLHTVGAVWRPLHSMQSAGTSNPAPHLHACRVDGGEHQRALGDRVLLGQGVVSVRHLQASRERGRGRRG